MLVSLVPTVRMRSLFGAATDRGTRAGARGNTTTEPFVPVLLEIRHLSKRDGETVGSTAKMTLAFDIERGLHVFLHSRR